MIISVRKGIDVYPLMALYYERCVMTKYLLKRLLNGLLSVVVVVAIVMLLVYTFVDRENIFKDDPQLSKKQNNALQTYKMQRWEKYGYLDYVSYSEYLNALKESGEIDEETRAEAYKIGRTEDKATDLAKEYSQKFREKYEKEGYTVLRLDAVVMGKKVANGGTETLFAYRDKPFISRFTGFFKRLIQIDDINYVEDDIENRGLTFTFYDPVYNTEPETGKLLKKKFSPALIGNGTQHKYLLYFDGQFPYLHQNIISIKLGLSFSVSRNNDVFDTMVNTQGAYVSTLQTYPTGLVEMGAEDLHTATYNISVGGDDETVGTTDSKYFNDNYSVTTSRKENKSRLGFSFVIGLIASLISYLVAVPVGIMMARKKGKLFDKLGTIYIVFIMAVPSLAYIFMFQALGSGVFKLPSSFDMANDGWRMYILPIISLALPSVASLMRWLRRYMIDQMNSDYVKFARSGGLSEGEIFSKHILKNAAIPLIHGIPGSVLGALVGAIITESVYKIPGAGGLLTNAINAYDNAVIVGLTLFYALISVVSVILGDILMSIADPRISFSSKAR